MANVPRNHHAQITRPPNSPATLKIWCGWDRRIEIKRVQLSWFIEVPNIAVWRKREVGGAGLSIEYAGLSMKWGLLWSGHSR